MIRARNSAGVSAWSNVATGATDPAPAIALSANGYKVKGRQHVDLSWSGAGGANVEIYRNGGLIATVTNNNAWTDAIGAKGGGSYTYQLCETDGGACSGEVVVTF